MKGDYEKNILLIKNVRIKGRKEEPPITLKKHILVDVLCLSLKELFPKTKQIGGLLVFWVDFMNHDYTHQEYRNELNL